jgi:hypothetical protein
MRAIQTDASIMRAFQTDASIHRQCSPEQRSPEQCFKRPLQPRVMCNCEFVALGGGGGRGAERARISKRSTCLLKNEQMAT